MQQLKIIYNYRIAATISGRSDGQHSIRFNDQWRIIFRWTANGIEFIDENGGAECAPAKR
jgi:plasmid maintenance system killer protein